MVGGWWRAGGDMPGEEECNGGWTGRGWSGLLFSPQESPGEDAEKAQEEKREHRPRPPRPSDQR